jgi:hypothetical protein
MRGFHFFWERPALGIVDDNPSALSASTGERPIDKGTDPAMFRIPDHNINFCHPRI